MTIHNYDDDDGAGEETTRWKVYGLSLPSLYGNASHFSLVQGSPGDEIQQEKQPRNNSRRGGQ